MSEDQKLATALQYLTLIASFGHVAGCESCAPVHECGCNTYSERELAQKALEEIGE